MSEIVTSASVIVIWNARTADPYDNRTPTRLAKSLSGADSALRTFIVLTPLRNGLVGVRVLQSHRGATAYCIC